MVIYTKTVLRMSFTLSYEHLIADESDTTAQIYKTFLNECVNANLYSSSVQLLN